MERYLPLDGDRGRAAAAIVGVCHIDTIRGVWASTGKFKGKWGSPGDCEVQVVLTRY